MASVLTCHNTPMEDLLLRMFICMSIMDICNIKVAALLL